MKIKRFTAVNMQSGLKAISEVLGPEAVILSNRKLSNGLEIVAGVDEQEYALYQDSLPEAAPTSDIIKAKHTAAGDTDRAPLDQEAMQDLFASMADKNQQAFSQVKGQASGRAPRPADQPKAQSKRPAEVLLESTPSDWISPALPAAPAPDFSLLRREIDGLRHLLQEQTEQLRNPLPLPVMSVQYERLEARLKTLGFTENLTAKLLRTYDREEALEQNWRKILGRLTSALASPLYEPLAQGGIFALTGPTGAGKTTTIAKLAAHCVKDYGASAVAVVSLDWFQVGGQEILRSVTDILGVEFHAMTEQESLSTQLNKLASKRIILIDTSGSAEALAHWNELMRTEPMAQRIQTVLVLPAIMHPASVNQFIAQHRSVDFNAVILSKLDESACFGGILEPVLKHRWPIWYHTTGQNIPQDIEPGDARKLTKRLVQGLQLERQSLATAS
ncbi:flagellar biosynthesis protein FlhF [Reinekea sp.]|jgi:flagellar biosynthesis protein FlhF|uniref:flagellar biosynthesis protein FlhF n=1 Tax=Reinekea sp. TaxID=1970455 RepID=UPI002A80614B|nr:flagellar biosynthesis protein FlhF [Reinekea sp.]